MKHRFSIMLVLLLAVSLAACSPIETPTPAIAPPVIDGSIMPGEWDTARRESLTDGSRLFLLKSGDYLYVGIQANPENMGVGIDLVVGNIYLYRGEEIYILHSSAALGTAIYQKTADGWSLKKGFTWCCREYSDSEEAQAERKTFLNRDGWVASICYMGNFNELEFKIRLTGEPMRMAVGFLNNPRARIVWPAGLQDDTLRFISADLTSSASFSPEKWAEVTVNRDGELEFIVPTPQE